MILSRQSLLTFTHTQACDCATLCHMISLDVTTTAKEIVSCNQYNPIAYHPVL